MALLTISGETASGWEEVAHGAASLLQFELVTEARLAQWVTEEFGSRILPARAWKAAATSVLARFATEHHLLIAVEGAEHLFDPLPLPRFDPLPPLTFNPLPLLMTVYIAAPKMLRSGHLMLEQRLEKPAALALLAKLEQERGRLRKARVGRASADRAEFDLTLGMANLDIAQAAEAIAAVAAARRLSEQGLLSAAHADRIQFSTRLQLARDQITPAGRAGLKRAAFSHPSEEMFANLLDFYRISWEYEPRSFPLQWNKDGDVAEAFTPDFYLPEFDLYVELTTMKQSLVTRKNRKVKLLRAIYPHVNIQVFYQKDYQDLIFKYGVKAS
jgi:hypothetical protein